MKKFKITFYMTVLLMALTSCNTNITQTKELNINELKQIGHLNTWECTFNNVAVIKQEVGTGFTHLFEKERTMFIEYDGIVKLGIDMDKIKYDVNKKVITIPKAEIFAVDKNIGEKETYLSDDNWFNKNEIKEEKLKDAINDSIETMKKRIAENGNLFRKAQTMGGEYIKNYVQAICKDKEITIEYE